MRGGKNDGIPGNEDGNPRKEQYGTPNEPNTDYVITEDDNDCGGCGADNCDNCFSCGIEIDAHECCNVASTPCSSCGDCNCGGCGECGQLGIIIIAPIVIAALVVLATSPVVLAGYATYKMFQRLKEDYAKDRVAGIIAKIIGTLGITGATTYFIYHKLFPWIHKLVLGSINKHYPEDQHNAGYSMFACHVIMLYISCFPLAATAGLNAIVRCGRKRTSNRQRLFMGDNNEHAINNNSNDVIPVKTVTGYGM